MKLQVENLPAIVAGIKQTPGQGAIIMCGMCGFHFAKHENGAFRVLPEYDKRADGLIIRTKRPDSRRKLTADYVVHSSDRFMCGGCGRISQLPQKGSTLTNTRRSV